MRFFPCNSFRLFWAVDDEGFRPKGTADVEFPDKSSSRNDNLDLIQASQFSIYFCNPL